MAYTLTFTFAAPTGTTIEAQLLDTSRVQVGSTITTGMGEIEASGFYSASISIPDSHSGSIIFRGTGGGTIYAAGAISPIEFQPEQKILTNAANKINTNSDGQIDINLTQIVPMTNVSTNLTQSVGDCLSASRADAAGSWTLVGTTLTIKNADNTTFRQFTLDSSTSPTTRT